MSNCHSTDDRERPIQFGTIVHSTWGELYGRTPCVTRYMAIAPASGNSWWLWPLRVPDYMGEASVGMVHSMSSAWHIAEDQEG